MYNIKDFFKKKEYIEPIEHPTIPTIIEEQQSIEEEQPTIMEEEQPEPLDELQYAKIHLELSINCISKTDSPLKGKIVRDIKNIIDIL